MSSITVRRMRFALPDEIETDFIAGQPEESIFNIAVSLLLPYIEPYLIRTMRAAKKQVTDAELAEDLDKFCAQEGQHYREHKRFNESFQGRGYDGLAELEHAVEADYQRWTATKSVRFNLAYAEGFEAMTTVMAHLALGDDMAHWHPAARDLFSWHLMEEMEHRHVAFEVYQHVCGDYFYRLAVGTFAQWHLFRFVDRASKHMMRATPELVKKHGSRLDHARRMARLWWRFFAHILPGTARTWLPWYSPRRIGPPAAMSSLRERYDAMAMAAASSAREPSSG